MSRKTKAASCCGCEHHPYRCQARQKRHHAADANTTLTPRRVPASAGLVGLRVRCGQLAPSEAPEARTAGRLTKGPPARCCQVAERGVLTASRDDAMIRCRDDAMIRCRDDGE
eukprot:1919673-Pyramimonas_sp.AAC.1